MAEQTLAGPGPQAQAAATGAKRRPHRQRAIRIDCVGLDSTRTSILNLQSTRRVRVDCVCPAGPRLSGLRLQLVLPKAGRTDHVRGNHMDQCSRRVLWSAGSLPCCARGALAYTRMLSKPSRAPRRRNFEWRVFTPPKKTRLSSDCSGRRRKVGLDRDRARSPRPTLMQLPRLGACPSSVCHACPAAPIRSRATPSARR